MLRWNMMLLLYLTISIWLIGNSNINVTDKVYDFFNIPNKIVYELKTFGSFIGDLPVR